MQVKAHELKEKSSQELLTQLDELKNELSQLRVAKATGGAASKLMKIKVVRKSIAKVLTVYNQKLKGEARAAYAGKKYVPQDLRPKKTRAIRRALTSVQKNAVTRSQKVRSQNFPKRRFAVAA